MTATGRVRVARIMKLNRALAWLLVLFGVATMLTGYGVTANLFDRNLSREMHHVLEWFFIVLLGFHVATILLFLKFGWKNSLKRILNREASIQLTLKFLQRLSGWAISIPVLLVIISGMDWYKLGIGDVLPFAFHIRLDVFLVITLSVHVSISGLVAIRRIKRF